MWRVALLLTGCNAVFGIHDTRQLDAAYFDAPPDAPFACPAAGPPRFSKLLHQDTLQACSTYFTCGELATGVCTGSNGIGVTMVGPPDTVLVEDPTLPQSDYTTLPYQYFGNPHPAADPTHFYIEHTHGDQGYIKTIDRYAFSNAAWAFDSTVPTTTMYPTLLSVSPAPAGDRIILIDGPNDVELVPDGSGSFSMTQSHAPTEVGLANLYSMTVSGDGLHALIIGTLPMATSQQMFWADRATTADWFGMVQPLPDLPLLYSSSMTPDCGRLYFPALGSILYLQQD